MTRLSAYILHLSFFLLAACNGEKEFMTPKTGEVVLDINAEEFSLNGKVLGKTTTDISASDDLLIESLDKELKRIRGLEQEEALKNGKPADEGIAKIHLGEDVSYDVFYKSIATIGFDGYVSIQFVIGSDFNEIYKFDLPERRTMNFYSCRQFFFKVSDWKFRNQIQSRQNISYNKILDGDVTKRNFELECIKKNIGLNLSFVRKNDGFFYELSLNETGLIDGVKIYSFEKDVDLWNFIEKVRSRNDLRVKEDKDEIAISLQKSVLMKDLAPIIKKLNSYDYRIYYVFFGG